MQLSTGNAKVFKQIGILNSFYQVKITALNEDELETIMI